MPRLGRYFLPDQPQHVIQRGNDRQAVFFRDEDREAYLGWLLAGPQKHGCRIHAYVLMTNHVHLLATPMRAESLPCMMQIAGTPLRALPQRGAPADRHAVGTAIARRRSTATATSCSARATSSLTRCGRAWCGTRAKHR
jgi:REP element-mobilizing transposase RayT